ncbi:hypothetical protein [Luteolibacter sp. Populi]|uniref:hypothetical protein n=1 Tax=Luteolibacter sp. Populi TaxID=3230487 RepID=UPI003467E124
MKSRDRVKLIRRIGDLMSALVEHPEHGEHKISVLSLDMPREFKTARGRWIPESDPRVEQFLRKALADVRAGGKKVEASADPVLRGKTEKELLWLLERNGWLVQQDVRLGPPWSA